MSRVHFFFRHTLFERGLYVSERSWRENGFRLKIEESDLGRAADSYQALRRGFENMRHYRVAGELYYREMTCRKKMVPLSDAIIHADSLLRVRVEWSKLFDWLWMRLFDVSCGFGEKPTRVVFGAILTILTFTGLYLPTVCSTSILGCLQSAFLLSIDAFTPGKFLNIPFTSPGEWLVQIEAVLGWFMLSLFLLVFTRKMSRS